MNCEDQSLSYTGLPLTTLLAIGGACLTVGLLLLILARTRRGRTAAIGVALLLLSVGLSASGPGESSARPAPSSCITITQTSPLTGLAPGIAPAAITGQITNHWPGSIFVTTEVRSLVNQSRACSSRSATVSTATSGRTICGGVPDRVRPSTIQAWMAPWVTLPGSGRSSPSFRVAMYGRNAASVVSALHCAMARASDSATAAGIPQPTRSRFTWCTPSNESGNVTHRPSSKTLIR